MEPNQDPPQLPAPIGAEHLDAFRVRAFEGLGWEGWLQAVVLVALVALVAYGLTGALQSALLLALPKAKRRAQEDPASWQWAWRGVSAVVGVGAAALLGGGGALMLALGACVGLGASGIVKWGRQWVRARVGAGSCPPPRGC